MGQVIDFFRELFNPGHFMPRWVCGRWSEFHGWLYIIADLTIFLAYMAIPVAMVYFVQKRWGDLPFRSVFWLFIAFISLCGTTHLIDAIIFYVPVYRFNALVLTGTAIVSVVTVGAMVRVLPQALAYKSPKELQQEVNQQTALLRQRVAQLNRMTERISRKKEQVENFAYITSHNLRAPAANLHSLIQLLRGMDTPARREEVMDMMARSGEQLLRTLDDVSRVLMESHPILPTRVIRFEDAVAEVSLGLREEIASSGAVITTDFGRCPQIDYPADHVHSILSNLLSNAIRYRHPDRHPEVVLRTWTDEDGTHVLTCTDNGSGIDLVAHRRHLFRLYHTFHGHPDSKGIGLFLIKHQLESLDGEIDVNSTVGVGTIFTVRFGIPEPIPDHP